MKRVGTVTIVTGVCALIGFAAVAAAKWDVFRAGNVILKFDGDTVPDALPRHEMAPIGVYGKIQVATADGTHPPAFRGGVFEVDRNATFEARGLATCKASQLEARDSKGARTVCGPSIIGSGQGTIEIAFPEQQPLEVTSPLTFFNGGVQGRTTTFFVHAFITVPVPAALITRVTIEKLTSGPYGLRIKSELPVVAGGSGSLVAARFNLKRLFEHKGKQRSYLRAKCPDGRIGFRVVETDFRIETAGREGSPSVSGKLFRPCTPKG
jgi:hypothetical protein